MMRGAAATAWVCSAVVERGSASAGCGRRHTRSGRRSKRANLRSFSWVTGKDKGGTERRDYWYLPRARNAFHPASSRWMPLASLSAHQPPAPAAPVAARTPRSGLLIHRATRTMAACRHLDQPARLERTLVAAWLYEHGVSNANCAPSLRAWSGRCLVFGRRRAPDRRRNVSPLPGAICRSHHVNVTLEPSPASVPKVEVAGVASFADARDKREWTATGDDPCAPLSDLKPRHVRWLSDSAVPTLASMAAPAR